MYQHAGTCDNQPNLKDIIDDSMVSTPYVVTNKILNVPMTSTPVKKPSARKSLCFFANIFDVKQKNSKTLYCSCKMKMQSHDSGYYPMEQEKNEN